MTAQRATPTGLLNDVERLPPADRRAEEALIGAVLVSASALDEIAELVTPVDFYWPAHSELFTAFLAVRDLDRPVAHLTVVDHLGARLEKLGGGPFLITCMQNVRTAANARYWAEIVAEKAVRRRLVEAGTRIAQLAYESNEAAAADLLVGARSTLDDVPAGGRAAAGRHLRRTLASEVVMRRLLFLGQDRIVLGALTLLAGREGLGKSTIAAASCPARCTAALGR